ncbi:MAG: hypothetical protein LBV22_02510 [Mycoplasmataceae bacterium]|jgi:hypothetical protein|nr:hypothetical protein [Mycoplasmataceae bacterium]
MELADGLKIEVLDAVNDIYQVVKFSLTRTNQVIQTTVFVGTLDKCLKKCGID